MSKRKIINDPVHGFMHFPFEIIYRVIDHPYFQRLRRISQLGLSHYVYPGACHTRFLHALGALHLMCNAVRILRSKDVVITEEEEIGVYLAILCHDIGHGPFSHALEYTVLNYDHEFIGKTMMEKLNEDFDGQFDLAIKIFEGSYPKNFLHQLVSSQLDMDRMDYLARDSFYTGVAEGVIGYDRIIAMLNVVEDNLVVEEKGLFSIQKYLVARHIMYWQVYLHKTVLSAEQMLMRFLKIYQAQIENDPVRPDDSPLDKLIKLSKISSDYDKDHLELFASIDDNDVNFLLKSVTEMENPLLWILSSGLLNRKLFKVVISNHPIQSDVIENLRQKTIQRLGSNADLTDQLLISGKETNLAYSKTAEEINILTKEGKVVPVSGMMEDVIHTGATTKYFVCYPQ